MLLIRFAYVDIFGSVITVQEASREPGFMRQWSDGLSHVLQPRFLFPNKPPLSDSEVYIRLARGDPTEESARAPRSASATWARTSPISASRGCCWGSPPSACGGRIYRYFMTRKIPIMVREGTVLVLVYSIGRDGVEISLPKMLGALIMFDLVFALLVKFAYPRVLAWLDRPMAAPKETRSRART